MSTKFTIIIHFYQTYNYFRFHHLIINFIGRRLKIMQTNVAELYATELSQTLMEEAVAEALSTLRKVIFYRYYHVFKRGELEELINGTPNMKILSCSYDNANWQAFAQKL